MYGTLNGLMFSNIPNDISKAAIATIFVHRVYLGVTPLTNDTTPLNFNKQLNDITSNDYSNSTIKYNKRPLTEIAIKRNTTYKLHHSL